MVFRVILLCPLANPWETAPEEHRWVPDEHLLLNHFTNSLLNPLGNRVEVVIRSTEKTRVCAPEPAKVSLNIQRSYSNAIQQTAKELCNTRGIDNSSAITNSVSPEHPIPHVGQLCFSDEVPPLGTGLDIFPAFDLQCLCPPKTFVVENQEQDNTDPTELLLLEPSVVDKAGDQKSCMSDQVLCAIAKLPSQSGVDRTVSRASSSLFAHRRRTAISQESLRPTVMEALWTGPGSE
ncbi:hypothetical protein DFJ77DRAFT_89595 [Powellomyces hirtus]|nr:hypothetical protein DFJ77DRAFT_89595 [Powellomyces hirtus]